jgi:hypothetical protein
MHLIQIADVAFCVVFRYNSYHSVPHPVHWDGTLPDGKRQLELSTFTGILLLRECEKVELVARERVPRCGQNKTTMLT